MTTSATLESLQHPALGWQSAYQLVLTEADKIVLFKCVEVTEAKLLMRLEGLGNSQGCRVERQEIEDAIKHLQHIKRAELNFRS